MLTIYLTISIFAILASSIGIICVVRSSAKRNELLELWREQSEKSKCEHLMTDESPIQIRDNTKAIRLLVGSVRKEVAMADFQYKSPNPNVTPKVLASRDYFCPLCRSICINHKEGIPHESKTYDCKCGLKVHVASSIGESRATND